MVLHGARECISTTKENKGFFGKNNVANRPKVTQGKSLPIPDIQNISNSPMCSFWAWYSLNGTLVHATLSCDYRNFS